jgi:hypothetical protein
VSVLTHDEFAADAVDDHFQGHALFRLALRRLQNAADAAHDDSSRIELQHLELLVLVDPVDRLARDIDQQAFLVNFEQLQVIPLLFVTPLTFLGGVFYSVNAIGEPWRTVTLLNPILYLVAGYRWTFFGVSDVPLWASVAVMAAAILLPLAAIVWVFRTGYRLKS